MELGGQDTAMDAALDALDTALTDVISTVESGGLEQLNAAGKVRCGSGSKRFAINCR